MERILLAGQLWVMFLSRPSPRGLPEIEGQALQPFLALTSGSLWQYWRQIFLLLLLVCVVARAPDLFTNPRFWAEEGRDAFAVAWSEPWYSALFHPHKDFFYLTMNLATLAAARLSSLETAPLVTTLVALAIQMAIFWYVLFPLSDSLKRVQQFSLSLVALFVGSTGETWLTTTTVQFQFAVLTFLILLRHQGTEHRRSWLSLEIGILTMAGLTGPVSNLLLPAFLLEWWRSRSREQALFSLALTITTLVQLGYLVSSAKLGGERLVVSDLSVVAIERWLRQFLLWPMFGNRLQDAISSYLVQGFLAGIVGAMAVWSTVASRRRDPWLPLLAFFLLSWGSLLGSPGMRGGWRYSYAPSFVLLSIFVLSLFGHKHRPCRWISAIAILISVLSWIASYRTSLSPWIVEDRPSWEGEVAKWREDASYKLKISPQWEGRSWTLDLDKEGR